MFIPPKVLLKDEGKQEVLASIKLPTGELVRPEQVLTTKGLQMPSKEYRKFINVFSVWVYRALCAFYNEEWEKK